MECGRFVNADGIAANTGKLLSGNMYAYCKNNTVNMTDINGARQEFSGTGHDTGEHLAVALAIMNNRYSYTTGTIIGPSTKSKSSSSIIPNKNQVASVALSCSSVWDNFHSGRRC